MLVLFETPAGYALFKVVNEAKLQEADNIWRDFETPDKASDIVKLVAFKRFKDTTDALEATASLIEGKIGKDLKKMLKKHVKPELQESLAVADAKMGNLIKDKVGISCLHSKPIAELFRGIRTQMDSLIGEIPHSEFAAMALGLAHSLSRYKLKFSADKVDTMIVQAVSLLDDLDKELNNYVMRCREWYSWHFPELGKLLQDHQAFAKVVLKMGMRQNARTMDLSDVLPEDLETRIKEEAEISMGTEISETDISNIKDLCSQIVEITQYRAQLADYLRNRMTSLAPNLTALVGELVGARLISHAGSLMNLAKYPASTIQILGAEKALFRALKTKKDTPKYGLIYHAQLIGGAHPKLKGKVSRMLAAKAALACRVDALAEDQEHAGLGFEKRTYLEQRIANLKDQGARKISGAAKGQAKFEKYSFKSEVHTYDATADSTLPTKRKRFSDNDDESSDVKPKMKKPKKEIVEEVASEEVAVNGNADETVEMDAEESGSAKKAKKKKKKKIKEEVEGSD